MIWEELGKVSVVARQECVQGSMSTWGCVANRCDHWHTTLILCCCMRDVSAVHIWEAFVAFCRLSATAGLQEQKLLPGLLWLSAAVRTAQQVFCGKFAIAAAVGRRRSSLQASKRQLRHLHRRNTPTTSLQKSAHGLAYTAPLWL